MKVKGITADQLRAIVETVSFEMYDGNVIFNREPETTGTRVIWVHFTLRVNDSTRDGHRITHSGRRHHSACWHVHRDVMREIFAANPDAVLETALAKYEGRDDFERKYPATGETNVGSMMQPLYMINACDCNA